MNIIIYILIIVVHVLTFLLKFILGPILAIVVGIIYSLVILFGFKKITQKTKTSAVTRKSRHLGKQFTDTIEDIDIEPYGCFNNLKDSFFIKKINPYSKNKQFDSGIIINEHSHKKDLHVLV